MTAGGRNETTTAAVRWTGRWIGLLVIALFVATILAKWFGLLPSPLLE